MTLERLETIEFRDNIATEFYYIGNERLDGKLAFPFSGRWKYRETAKI